MFGPQWSQQKSKQFLFNSFKMLVVVGFTVLTRHILPRQKIQFFVNISWFVYLEVLYSLQNQSYYPTKTVLWMWEDLIRQAWAIFLCGSNYWSKRLQNQPIWILSSLLWFYGLFVPLPQVDMATYLVGTTCKETKKTAAGVYPIFPAPQFPMSYMNMNLVKKLSWLFWNTNLKDINFFARVDIIDKPKFGLWHFSLPFPYHLSLFSNSEIKSLSYSTFNHE